MEEERSGSGRLRNYHLLDALRGIAALLIVQRHSVPLLGTVELKATFLAVDLFFVLSGFVIAHAYEQKLAAGASRAHFFALRVIRLYPLYIVGIALGALEMLLAWQDGTTLAASGSLIGGIAMALIMIPSWGLVEFNGPRWSLFYELVANAVYALVIRHLTTRNLFWFVAICGSTLMAMTARGAVLQSGWDIASIGSASTRVGFSFFAGVFLYRLHAGLVGRREGVSFAAIGLALATLALLCVPHWPSVAYLIMIFVIFPALVLAAARIVVTGTAAKLCAFMGVASYAIYVLHVPMVALFVRGMQTMGFEPAATSGAGVVFLGTLLAIAWLLDRYYDAPTRRLIVAHIGPLRAPVGGADHVMAGDAAKGNKRVDFTAHGG